jgi:hypothetical protein
MQTEEGRAMAAERVEFLRAFRSRLLDEIAQGLPPAG